MGANGGPDWRAMLAGEDAKALERLARYQSPTEVTKALIEAQTKLSQRAEPLKVGETSTPEQIAEYRKANDVPDVPRDAANAAYADAYGLKLPEGVDLPPEMLGAFAKSMNAKHVPKSVVQQVIGEYATIQKAMSGQIEKIATEKAREWQNGLRDQLGSKEYDGQLNAATKWLASEFKDNPTELQNILGAQLPGGGKLGDHPWLFKLVAEKAMGSGFTDRIEANAMESNGKSLAAQQQEIESLRRTNRALYNDPSTQDKLKQIIKGRLSRGELDEYGNEVRPRRQA